MAEQFEHGYALIIGVDDNKIKRLALPDVAKDVKALHDVIVHPERCGYNPDNVKMISGADSTKDNIINALYWLQDKVADDGDATAIIYYSGHGMVDKEQYYLIPYDIGELRHVRRHAIKAEKMTEEIASIQSKRMLVMLDCCHAGGMDIKSVDLDAPPAINSAAFPVDLPEIKSIPTLEEGSKNVSQLATGEGRAILNSSTGSQSSYMRKDGAMSMFTYHLIEALTGHAPHEDGDQTVLVTDVMGYVTRHVEQTAQAEGRAQTPVMRTSGVFPVAQLIGGQGLSKGIDGLSTAPPDPLAPLPSIQAGGSVYTGDITAGGDVAGGDINKHEGDVIHGNVDNSASNVDTGGGAYVAGINTGGGEFTMGNKTVNEGDTYHGNVDKSTTTNTTSFNMDNQTVEGDQINAAGDVNIGHMGDKVDMGSGDYVKGDKNIHGDVVHGDKFTGDKIGGDKISGDKISIGSMSGSNSGIAIGRGATSSVDNSTHNTTNSGDTINMSGDFRGSNVNVKSTLSNVQQTISSAPSLNNAEKQVLENLIEQLEQALAQVPEAHKEEVETVSQAAEMFVNTATKETPNKMMFDITGDGLKKAAQNLAAITPDVLKTATGIVMMIGQFVGM